MVQAGGERKKNRTGMGRLDCPFERGRCVRLPQQWLSSWRMTASSTSSSSNYTNYLPSWLRGARITCLFERE